MLQATIVVAFAALVGGAARAQGQGIPAHPRADTSFTRPDIRIPAPRRYRLGTPNAKPDTTHGTRTVCPIPTVRPDTTQIVPMPKARIDSLAVVPMPVAAPGCTPDSTR